MCRSLPCLTVVAVALLLGWQAAPGNPTPVQAGKSEAPQKEKPPQPPTTPAQLQARLMQPIAVQFDQVPLQDALEFLQDRSGLNILVDTEAFKQEGIGDIEMQPVKLRKLTGVRLATVLRMLLSQVHATYLVRPDHLEITTLAKAAAEVWGAVENEMEDSSQGRRPMLRLVEASFEGQQLGTALRELSEMSGVSIVLDIRRVAENAKTPVTAALHNVPVDTAVRILANQAELRAVLLDNVLYVTDVKNAAVLQAEQSKINSKGLDKTLFMPAAAAGM